VQELMSGDQLPGLLKHTLEPSRGNVQDKDNLIQHFAIGV